MATSHLKDKALSPATVLTLLNGYFKTGDRITVEWCVGDDAESRSWSGRLRQEGDVWWFSHQGREVRIPDATAASGPVETRLYYLAIKRRGLSLPLESHDTLSDTRLPNEADQATTRSMRGPRAEVDGAPQSEARFDEEVFATRDRDRDAGVAQPMQAQMLDLVAAAVRGAMLAIQPQHQPTMTRLPILQSFDFETALPSEQQTLIAGLEKSRSKVTLTPDLQAVPSVGMPDMVFALYLYIKAPDTWRRDAETAYRLLVSATTAPPAMRQAAAYAELAAERAVHDFARLHNEPPRRKEDWFPLFHAGAMVAHAWAALLPLPYKESAQRVMASFHKMWSGGQYDPHYLWSAIQFGNSSQRPLTSTTTQGAHRSASTTTINNNNNNNNRNPNQKKW